MTKRLNPTWEFQKWIWFATFVFYNLSVIPTLHSHSVCLFLIFYIIVEHASVFILLFSAENGKAKTKQVRHWYSRRKGTLFTSSSSEQLNPALRSLTDLEAAKKIALSLSSNWDLTRESLTDDSNHRLLGCRLTGDSYQYGKLLPR